MAHRIKQIFLRPAMGIMAGDTGIRARQNTPMGHHKLWCSCVMTTGAQITHPGDGHGGKIGTMGLMAGAAILCRGLMHESVTPVFGDPGMAAQTQGRLAQVQITTVNRAVTIVAGRAITLLYRLMTNSKRLNRRGNIAMTIKADRSRGTLDQIGLIAAVGTMTA
jgi:hypothetical protein